MDTRMTQRSGWQSKRSEHRGLTVAENIAFLYILQVDILQADSTTGKVLLSRILRALPNSPCKCIISAGPALCHPLQPRRQHI